MKILFLTAGAGGTYCGACNQDSSLVRQLINRGHEVEFIPLYTPLTVDGKNPAGSRIFYGGVNVYLQQQFKLFQKIPSWMDGLFDNPALLKWVSSFALNTNPAKLGPMTLSVLQGEEGHQKKEIQKLVGHLQKTPRPDLAIITNTMLSGLGPVIKRELQIPVACQVQGEEAFLQALGFPYSEKAREVLKEQIGSLDGFIAPSLAYLDLMASYLEIEPDRFEIIPPGIDEEYFKEHKKGEPQGKLKIGYLSRIQPNKGLDLLVEALNRLKEKGATNFKLKIAGEIIDKKYWKQCLKALQEGGWQSQMEFLRNPNLEEKMAFLRELDFFCLPSKIFESRGIAPLEAMALGVPALLPDRGIYRELIEHNGGGLLFKADCPKSLAENLETILRSPSRHRELGARAREGVMKNHTAEGRVQRAEEVYKKIIEKGGK